MSLILRGSAYFISPYPLGSDVWGHAEYIKNFLNYGHLVVSKYPSGVGIGQYYTQYPIMHLFTVASKLILDISVHKSMFIVAATIVFGTVFVYIFTKQITGSTNISLLSMLLISFSDSQIQWSIQPIAMTIGILFYIILIYMLLTRDKYRTNGEYHINKEKQLIHASLTIFFVYILILTHTVSSFIAFVSITSIYISKFVFRSIYKSNSSEKSVVDITFCVLFATVMISYWIDPKYPFFTQIIEGFSESASSDMRFLGETAIRNISNNLGDILNIIGFLIYTLFGIIGSLSCLSRKNITIPKFSLIFSTAVLFTLFFGFPLMGLRNIIPYRWPAFIFVIFVPFIGMGIVNIVNIFKMGRRKFMFFSVFVILFISFFFMITSNVANLDSPVYGKEVFQPLRWMESEITMYKDINQSYNGTIVGDAKTIGRPFRTYLIRNNTMSYPLTGKAVDWNNDKLIIWRRNNVYEPVQFQLDQLKDNFNYVYDTGEGKAFTGEKK